MTLRICQSAPYRQGLQDTFALEIPTAIFQCRIRHGDEGAHVPFFSMGEFDYVLCKMKKGRCADNDGFLTDMFKYASVKTKECLLDLLNDILKTGNLESSCHSIFVMLPKSGDLSDTNNWRPIAIFRIPYNFFHRYCIYSYVANWITNSLWASLVSGRKQELRKFVVLEAIMSKTLEWQCGIWLASLDLRKAF